MKVVVKKLQNGGGASLLDRCSKGFGDATKLGNYFLDDAPASGSVVVLKTIPNLSLNVNKAFTLSEVLITLGIIGVVATLTIPNLVTNYQKKQAVVKLKKVFTNLNNVVKLSEIDNGPAYCWSYPQQESSSYDRIAPFIEKYYLPYYKSAKLYRLQDFDRNYHMKQMNSDENVPVINNYVVLFDGTILSFFANIPNGYMWIFADINGKNLPNRVGKDIFVFTAYLFSKEQTGTYGQLNIRFWSDSDINKVSRLKLKDPNSHYGCSRDSVIDYGAGFYCGALIQYDGWKISDDYPWD